MQEIDLNHLYAVLAAVARREGQFTYGELSQAYMDRTDEWYEPHGSWDEPLGRLNVTLHAVRWLSTSLRVVIRDDETREPGGGSWESSANVPARPTNEINRIAEYSRLLRDVYRAPWPEALPTAPPPS